MNIFDDSSILAKEIANIDKLKILSGNQSTPNSVFKDIIARKKLTADERRALFGNGKARKRLDITMEDLATYTNDKEVQKKAHYDIVTVDFENLKTEDVINWGGAEQKRSSNLVENILDVMQERAVLLSKSLLTEIVENLEQTTMPVKGAFFGFIQRTAEDKVRKFNNTWKKLENTINVLEQSTPDLHRVSERVQEITNELKGIEELVNIKIVSAGYLSSLESRFAQGFLNRYTSLCSTLVMLRTNLGTIKLFEDSVMGLIDTISNVLHVELPMWRTNYAANLAMSNGEMAYVMDQQKRIVNKIKKFAGPKISDDTKVGNHNASNIVEIWRI